MVLAFVGTVLIATGGDLSQLSLPLPGLLCVRFASGRIGDGDVDDVRKIVFVDFVGLIQLLPH